MKVMTPVNLIELSLRNRLIMPAISTGYAHKDGTVSDRQIDFYRARAKGGVALIVLEQVAVHPLGLGYGRQLRAYGDHSLDGFKRLAAAVHEEGAKIFMQLAHAGRQTLRVIINEQPVAPSPLPCMKLKETPKELSLPEVEEIERAFILGAVKARDSGCDGVELHAAHGYLLCQFLSPLSNIRTDRYGGDTLNRTRIVANIISGIREAVGPGFPVFVKISAEEYCEGGLTIGESLKIAKILEDSGASAITASAGNYGSFDWVIQPAEKQPGCLAHLSFSLKRNLHIPIIAVGRINDVNLAEKIVQEGKADLIAVGRALLADPYLPRKAADGRWDEMNRCIADNGCVRSLVKGGDIVCTVNPNLGTEKELVYS